MSNKHNFGDTEKTGMTVVVRNNDVEKAIKKLKKMILAEGIMKELKDREGFEKPSAKKRKSKIEAKRKYKKNISLRIKHEGY